MNTWLFSAAAAPSFLRASNLLHGFLDFQDARPKRWKKAAPLRAASAAHALALVGVPTPDWPPVEPAAQTINAIGLGLLSRGYWTVPSWRLEQYLAEFASTCLG